MSVVVNDVIRVTLVCRQDGQRVENVFDYVVTATTPGWTGGRIGEKWWDAVKNEARAMVSAGFPTPFQSVRVRNLTNPAGVQGEYAIPQAEQQGTRPAPPGTDSLPPFNTASARLVVGTGVTRPGQKRVSFLTEADNSVSVLSQVFRDLFNAFLLAAVSSLSLVSPGGATMTLGPVVVGLNPDGTVRAFQLILGWVINSLLTSQVSRRIGRGV